MVNNNENKISFIMLRPATDLDIDFLHRLNKATMKSYVVQTWGEWDENWQREYLQNRYQVESFLIIQCKAQDIGCLSIEVLDDSVHLRKIALLPEFQGRGIGSQLIRLQLIKANEQNKPITLRVLKVNPAQKLYERLGFSITEETITHYLMTSSMC